MANKNRVVLACSECLPVIILSIKNKKTNTERLELMKFCKKWQ